MIHDEIRQVRRDLQEWATTMPDEIRFRAAIIVGNLHRLEHWPDDRPMQFETLRNIAALERALRLNAPELDAGDVGHQRAESALQDARQRQADHDDGADQLQIAVDTTQAEHR